jgi:Tol biopolymer transport system component
MQLKRIICTLAAALGAAVSAPAALASHETFPGGEDPDWSPDGRQFVYVRTLRERADLWLMDANGHNKHPLMRTPANESDPSWSPDGTRIAYSARAGDGRSLFVVELATRKVTQLTDGVGYDYGPDWSPDGTQLAFSRYDEEAERGQLFTMNADGSAIQPLVVDDGDDATPRWSPDGRFVAFTGGPEDEAYIDVVEVATHAHRRLTDEGSEYTPAWTADGRIVFSKAVDDDVDVWIMNGDGTGQRRLLGFDESDEWSAVPSPDGRRLAYVSDRDTTNEVFVARADGSGVKRLTGVPYFESASGSRCTIWGTAGADTLRGTAGEDVICGLGGNDVVFGLGADDTLDGGAGNDRLLGGEGTDSYYGGPGNDIVESRDDRRESIDGGPGYDRARSDASDWLTFVEAWL